MSVVLLSIFFDSLSSEPKIPFSEEGFTKIIRYVDSEGIDSNGNFVYVYKDTQNHFHQFSACGINTEAERISEEDCPGINVSVYDDTSFRFSYQIYRKEIQFLDFSNKEIIKEGVYGLLSRIN